MMSIDTGGRIMQSLEDHMLYVRTPEGLQDYAFPDPAWQITDAEAADWAGRKVRKLHAERAKAHQQFDDLVVEARAWLEGATTKIDQDISFFEGHLQAWLEREIEADDSMRPKQSRSLPCGVTVKRIKGRERVDVFDEDAFVAWALDTEHTDLVKVTHKASKVDIAGLTERDGQFITDDGEIAPGVTKIVGEDRFKVEVGSNDD